MFSADPSWKEDKNGTNESGFDAKAAGYLMPKSEFGIASEGAYTGYWMSADADDTNAYLFTIRSNNKQSKFIGKSNKSNAYACRCIKK